MENDPGSQLIAVPARRQVEQTISDSDPTHSSGDARKSQLAGNSKTGVMRLLLFGAMAVCLLLWVAIYNGYPTVYPDTGSYFYTGAFRIPLPPFRAPGYSVFTNLTGLGASAWFIVATQAIFVVATLFETCKYLIGGESKFRDTCMLVIISALAALTSLPWEVSLLMPDVFAGMVFLSAFLLGCNGKLRMVERIGLASILTISVSAHLSLLPIAVLFAAALAVPRLAGWRPPGAPPVKSMLAWLVVPILAAGCWTATLNYEMGLGFKLSVSGNEFLLGRLFGDGLASDYLRENCPQKPFVACRYLADLPKTPDQFLFWSPLLYDMAGHGDEIQQVVRGTIAAYPLRFVWTCLKDTLLQLAEFRTGDEIRASTLNAPNTNGAVIQQIFPRDLHAFANSRQSRGRMTLLTKTAALVDTVVFCLSALACLFLATKRAQSMNQFFYALIAFLVINAAICGSLAGVYNRYQSRVAWIVPLCLAFYICSLFRDRKRANR